MSGIAVVSLLCTLFGYSILSALVPFMPVEPTVAGLAIVAPHWSLVIVGIGVAALGQMLGKLVILQAGAKSKRAPSERRRRWSGDTERLERTRNWLKNGRYTTNTLCLVSSLVGIPPFAIVTFVLGRLQYSWRTFIVIGLLGRTVRFAIVATAPMSLGMVGFT